MNEFIIQAFGYLASLLLGISLSVNNDLKFRWFSMFGCLVFIIYGALIGAFPVMLTNAGLLVINLYYLVKIYNTEEDFDLCEFKVDDAIIQKFITFYKKDIEAYFPSFDITSTDNDIKFIVLRDMAIANIFVATIKDGDGIVKINYTVPKYRDYKVGRFILEKENKFLIQRGVRRLVYLTIHNPQHASFLKAMKFETINENGKEIIARSIA